MRKIVCMVVASALVLAGAYLFTALWMAPGPVKILYFLGPGALFIAGMTWLYEDLKPSV